MVDGKIGFNGAGSDEDDGEFEWCAFHLEDFGYGVESGFGGAVDTIPWCWSDVVMVEKMYGKKEREEMVMSWTMSKSH